jgi:hypothetical protein
MMRSTIHVADRRFGIAMFPSFYGTRPTHEEAAASAGRIADLIAPEDGPMIAADKERGLFFVPCALKEAPLIGKTLEQAVKQGLATTGKMRSGGHVTAGAWAKIDGDGLTEEQLAAALATLNLAGIAHLIYSTHSHGRADKPGIRCRIVVFFDRALEPAEYHGAVLSFSTWLFRYSLDESEARLCQQAGGWCAHPDRLELAFCYRQLDGVCVSTDALLAAAPVTTHHTGAQGSTSREVGALPIDAARIVEALKWIDPNAYGVWVDAAIWLKSAYGDAAYPLWLAWSETANREAQEGNDGRYALEKVWAGISPRLTTEQGAGTLYAKARDSVVATVREAAAVGLWAGQGTAGLVYLRRFHPRLFNDMFGEAA